MSQSKQQVFDRIRNKWVACTPEERIRQKLIIHMIDKLHYPQHLIAVEQELASLSNHFKTQQPASAIPKRRIDIVVFSHQQLQPLLIIECKAVSLTPQFAGQVIGYNAAFIEAPFVALANEEQVMTGAFDPTLGSFRFKRGLPDFKDLGYSR